MVDMRELIGEIPKKCPYCGSDRIIIDVGSGEAVCMGCGRVIEENLIDSGKEWREFDDEVSAERARVGPSTSPVKVGFGLTTEFDLYSKGVKLPQEIRKKAGKIALLQWRATRDTMPKRSVSTALPQLKRAASSLGLSDHVIEEAAMIYRKASAADLIKGRSVIATIAAAVYIAVRLNHVARTLEEVAKEFGISEKDLGRNFRLLIRELNLKLPPPSPEAFVERICRELKLPGEVAAKAHQVLKKAREAGITMGKEPCGIAAAAVYMACQETNEKRTQRELAQAAGVTEVTVRNRFKELVNKLYPGKAIVEEIASKRRE
ncbi:MAG: transcription initiation factor IIB [Thermoproteota archaeon]|nr:MAG: transcription initiation factor IIB [Candidatus Korarchaeota archaeon]RLG56085.1 MAG: transcription initiation factor IIB [Candidatus Korarchaeota archaeon]